MQQFLQRLSANVMPVVGLLAFAALLIVGLLIFSYLIAIVAVIGLILFVIAFIRHKLMRPERRNKHLARGRVIDHQADE